MIKRVTVFCASSTKLRSVFYTAAEELAKCFIKENVELVFGGGAVGLMGKMADVILENNGKIQGVIPEFMKEVEWNHPGVNNMIIVETMHQRKELLIQNVDAVVALPGGTGTFEELLEVVTLKRLGLFIKPIVIVNTDGYYNSLKELLENAVMENFLNNKHKQMWSFVETAEEVFPTIRNTKDWDSEARKFALV